MNSKPCKFCNEEVVYNRDTRRYDNVSGGNTSVTTQHFCVLGGISQILYNQHTILNLLKSMNKPAPIDLDFDTPMFSNTNQNSKKVKEVSI